MRIHYTIKSKKSEEIFLFFCLFFLDFKRNFGIFKSLTFTFHSFWRPLIANRQKKLLKKALSAHFIWRDTE